MLHDEVVMVVLLLMGVRVQEAEEEQDAARIAHRLDSNKCKSSWAQRSAATR